MNDVLDWLDSLNPALTGATAFITLVTVLTGTALAFVRPLIRTTLARRYLDRRLRRFYTEAEIRRATECYVPTRCQNIDPAQEHEPSSLHAFAAQILLVPWLVKLLETGKADRYYIVLADSGMGKTTFMINFFLRYSRKRSTRYAVRLVPLGYDRADAAIDEIEEKESTVLLLDAFDEDALAIIDYAERLQELIEKTRDFRAVVLTSRTQFFPSHVEEPAKTGILKHGVGKGEHEFKKLYVSPFDDDDVNRFLRLKLPFYRRRQRRRAKAIVERCPHLVVRPMLLTYIDSLMEEECDYQTSQEIYEAMVDHWIRRERVADKEELRRFSEELAVDMYRHQEERKGLVLGGEELVAFAAEHDVRLEDFEMKGRSLLNRDAEGRLKFAHKSILEYFLALELHRNPGFFARFRFEHMDFAGEFLVEMSMAQPLVEPLTGTRFLWIPGGRFQMGSKSLENTKPVHEVRVSSFWLAETPVTHRQYEIFLRQTGNAEPALWRDPRFSAPDQPLVGVSWNEARVFCQWLARASGLAIDLPTEAQWEYAARGRESREYPWGDEDPKSSLACFGQDWSKGQPAAVGSYAAGKGPFGTLDQAGNVWEWCLDAYDEAVYAKRREAGEVVDPIQEAPESDDALRVLRGGAWGSPADSLRAACRGRLRAAHRDVDTGFRLCAAPLDS